jgi:hypothetical protein
MKYSPKEMPEGTDRLLLVEGKSDVSFFVSLLKHLYPNSSGVWVMSYDGVGKLSQFVQTLLNAPNFKTIKHLGIVRDADYEGTAFQSVVAKLKTLNQKAGVHLPIPTQARTFAEGAGRRLGVFIMPDEGEQGMLETLLWRAVQDDPIRACVDAYFDCLQARAEIDPKPNRLPKALLRAYLATLGIGRDVDKNSLAHDSEYEELYRKRWWRWDNPVFAPVQAFMRQLAEGELTPSG